MQDLLRQRGNTAELCSLCCQHSCKGEEGGSILEEEEEEREEEERESANNVILFRRQCCSQLCLATRTQHRRPPGSKFRCRPSRQSPPDWQAGTHLLFPSSPSACVCHLSATLPKCVSRGVDVCVSVCMPAVWKLLLPPLHQPEPGSQAAVGIFCPLIHV